MAVDVLFWGLVAVAIALGSFIGVICCLAVWRFCCRKRPSSEYFDHSRKIDPYYEPSLDSEGKRIFYSRGHHLKQNHGRGENTPRISEVDNREEVESPRKGFDKQIYSGNDNNQASQQHENVPSDSSRQNQPKSDTNTQGLQQPENEASLTEQQRRESLRQFLVQSRIEHMNRIAQQSPNEVVYQNDDYADQQSRPASSVTETFEHQQRRQALQQFLMKSRAEHWDRIAQQRQQNPNENKQESKFQPFQPNSLDNFFGSTQTTNAPVSTQPGGRDVEGLLLFIYSLN